MRKLVPAFHQAMEELVAMVDADSCAFSSYMVGAKMLEAVVFGAYFNVMINLKGIMDDKFKLVARHHRTLQCALLPLQDILVLAQVPPLAVRQSAPHTLLLLASTPTGNPRWDIILMDTRSTLRSTIRSTIRSSTASTMKASPLVVHAAQAEALTD
ncbi:unnamed protein product [Coccothraustes coccothraustes]